VGLIDEIDDEPLPPISLSQNQKKNGKRGEWMGQRQSHKLFSSGGNKEQAP
jgi:hypothetical protein